MLKLDIGSQAPKSPRFEAKLKNVVNGSIVRHATDNADGIANFHDRNKIVQRKHN
jgi:hypothetical protein